MQSFQLYEHASTVPVDSLDPSFEHQDWQNGYRSLHQEFDYWVEDVEGQIPLELEGTLFRNGPGSLDVNGHRIHHPFDGDGMISAIAFKDGRAYFHNRFVRTEGFLAEQSAGQILYRGVFGTQKPGGWLANAFDFRMKNIANTQVIYWGDKLLALWEAAEPHRLDPRTLDTLGLEHFDGALEPGSPFAAHPRIDPECEWDNHTPHLVTFSIKVVGLSSTITIYELNAAGQIIHQHSHSVPGFAFIHDFVITPNYCVFFQNPVSFNPIPFVLGWRGAGECIQFRPEQMTRILVIPRRMKPGCDRPVVQMLETKSGFVFHHANAFEQGDQLYIDSICYESLPSVEPNSDYREVNFEALSPGQLWRFCVNLQTRSVQRRLIEPRCCEFPFIHPAKMGRAYRYVYLGAAHQPRGNAPLQAILKLDLETSEQQLWSAAPRGFVSEPVFVPRTANERLGLSGSGEEDEGWLLTFVYDAECDRTDVVILDARNLNQGPVAKLHLKHHIPYGLHGTFTPHWFGPAI